MNAGTDVDFTWRIKCRDNCSDRDPNITRSRDNLVCVYTELRSTGRVEIDSPDLASRLGGKNKVDLMNFVARPCVV